MIENSVDKVSSGTKLVKEAGTTMQDIVKAVARVTEMMSEIQAASAEQKEGIEQVNEAIHQMDEMTQQNAALVEEAMAIASSVHDQTRKLTEAVEKFKIPETETSHWENQPGSLSFMPGARPASIESNIKLLR